MSLLQVTHLGKAFPGVLALDDVGLACDPGEVLAVVGENGAGKSTLMKILAGVQRPDRGEVRIAGRPVPPGSVRASLSAGIALIHQELSLCDNLDVAANIFLGREPCRFGVMQRRRMAEDAARLLDRVGLDASPSTLVATLSPGRRQLVEIARALSVDARLIIMDEPSSSLSSAEAEGLFDVVRDLRRQGVAILYVSHRLGEVQDLADRVLVLRDGRVSGVLDRKDLTHETMVRLMVGRDLSRFYVRHPHAPGDLVLEAQDLVTDAWPQHRLSFSVRRGEVVGIAGLVGAGRTELLETLFGIRRARSGVLRIDGRPVPPGSPSAAIAAGLALVPEDRKEEGLILDASVRDNLSLPSLRAIAPMGVVDRRRERALAARAIAHLGIRTPSDLQTVRNLSGGNQQKVVLGKWLATKPCVLLLDEPTRGIDIGAKAEIYRLVDELAKDGLAVLFASSEMEEVIGIADRVLVMHEGRLVGALDKEAVSEEAVLALATGGAAA